MKPQPIIIVRIDKTPPYVRQDSKIRKRTQVDNLPYDTFKQSNRV